MDGLYVDHLMLGGPNVEEVAEKKAATTEMFEDATFALHKWHSNREELENNNHKLTSDEASTYAKQQLDRTRSRPNYLACCGTKAKIP